MAHVVQLKRSATTTAAPTAGQLSAGELAINTVDETIFFKNSSGTVKKLSAMSDLTSNMVLLTGAQTVAGVKTFSSNILLTGTGIDTNISSTFYIASQSATLNVGVNATSVQVGATGGNSTFNMGDFQLYRTLSKVQDTLYVTLAAADTGISCSSTLGIGVGGGQLTLGDWDGAGNGSTILVDDANQLVTSNTPISVSSTTVSTSSTTGALIVAGGAGIAKNSFINGHSIGVGLLASQTNLAFGINALAATTTGGVNNTAIGAYALDVCTSGTLNSGLGANALGALTTGGSNVGIGSTAGSNLTTGSNNTIIGAAATVSAVGDSNSIVIGKSAVGLGTNTTVIGVSTTTSTKIFGTLTLDDTALISSSSATAKAIKSTVPAGTGVTPTVQIICPSSAQSLVSQTATQAVFSAAQDTITLQASTTYMFDGLYLLSTGTTSHATAMSFVLTTATMTNCTWITSASAPAALNATAAGVTTAIWNSVTGGTVNSASVQPYTTIKFNGVMRVNAAGTLVPNIAFVTNAPGGTNTTMIGSYLAFYPIGSNTIDFVGSAIG